MSLQFQRYAKGESFQEQVRRSWKLIPCWRRKLRDGGGLENPSDELVLTNSMNLLIELKRTDGNLFSLSMLRESQKQGLVDFDKVLDRNIGMVFVDFEAYEECYAFRFANALRWMQKNNRKSIPLEVFRGKGLPTVVYLPRIDIDGELGFDVRRLIKNG